MYELFNSLIGVLQDFLFWPFIMFVGFCITNAILPEKHVSEEEFEERLK